MAKSKKSAKSVKQDVVSVEREEPQITESVDVRQEGGTIYGMTAILSDMCDKALSDISELCGVLSRDAFVVEKAELPDNLIDRLDVVERKLGEIISSIGEISQVVGR